MTSSSSKSNLKEEINWHLTEEGQRVMDHMNAPSPSCLKCSHFLVCKIFGTMNAYMANSYPDGVPSPMKPDDLAKICTLYTLDHKFVEIEEDAFT